MPLRTLMRFRNPDVTADINARLRNLVSKGVFFGGQVLPVAGTLDVSVSNFGAIGSDGMVTVLEGATETLTCTPGFTQWVVLHAYYVANDDPVAALQVLTEAEYDALSTADRDRRVRLARVTLGVAATEVTSQDISFVQSELTDPVGRGSFRGVVPTRTALPEYTDPATGLTTINRGGDLYFVEDERVFYSWTETGTPTWQRVISALEEFALAEHKLNQDDGTEAPDFYEAQHVLVKHRRSLDAGTASRVLHGSTSGTDFGLTNPLVDAAFPVSITYRSDHTGLVAAVKVPLTGTYYVGTGAVGTATTYFRMAGYQTNEVLFGTDRRPIGVFKINRSDDVAELDPSVDADALGYYDDPIVLLDLTATVDVTFTGNLSVYGSLRRNLGQVLPSDGTVSSVGLGFVQPAESIPVHSNNFLQIVSPADVQEALEDLDAAINGLAGGADETVKKIVNLASLAGGPDPNELNWYGGTGGALGRLDDVSDNPRVNALANDLYFEVPSGQEFSFRWNNTPLIAFDGVPQIKGVASSLSMQIQSGYGFFWNVDTTSILALAQISGNPQLSAPYEDLWFNVPTGKTYDWRINSGSVMSLSATRLSLPALNCGGSATPASGSAIFSNGVVVGFDANPTADELQVGDAAFGVGFDGTDPFVRFDLTGGTDRLWYDRSGNAYFFEIGGGTESILDASGLRVNAGLYVGGTGTVPPGTGDIVANNYLYTNGKRLQFGTGTNDWIDYNDTSKTLGITIDGGTEYTFTPSAMDVASANITSVGTLGCTNVEATGYLQAATLQLDAGDKLVFTNNTSVSLIVNSVEEFRLRTDGLAVNKGLYVGGVGGTTYDDDAVLSGGINVGGNINPAPGDGIFTRSIVVGFDQAPFSDDRVIVGNNDFSLHWTGTDPYVYFDSSDYLFYDRSANGWQFSSTGDVRQRRSFTNNDGTANEPTVVYAYNNGAATIAANEIVELTTGGSTTAVIQVQQTSGANSATVFGVASASIAPSAIGRIVVHGVFPIDTGSNGATVGDCLASSATAGKAEGVTPGTVDVYSIGRAVETVASGLCNAFITGSNPQGA